MDSTTVADVLAQLCGFAPIALRAAANLLRLGEYTPLALAERMFDERHRLDRIGSVGIRAPIAAILSVASGRLSTRGARAVRALATFPADFDRAAARALEVDTATLDELLDRGFVQRRGDDRLLLHDLYRLYARTRAEADDRAAFELARMMHAAYFVNMAAHVAELWREGDPTANTALSAMDAEWPNFDDAYAWAVTYAERTEDAVALEELVLNLRWLLIHLRDAETLLAWSQKAHDIAIAQSRWADASRHLVSIAIAHYLRGDSAAEQEAQERGLALAERVNDEDLIRAHAGNVAVSLEYAGRLPEALALLEHPYGHAQLVVEQALEASAAGPWHHDRVSGDGVRLDPEVHDRPEVELAGEYVYPPLHGEGCGRDKGVLRTLSSAKPASTATMGALDATRSARRATTVASNASSGVRVSASTFAASNGRIDQGLACSSRAIAAIAFAAPAPAANSITSRADPASVTAFSTHVRS